ncbi:MAG: hypothetical protein LBV39_05955 [Bacteroidales bacterium]|nr:hypothetical protein [Bacteroidales bacterium]
MKKNTGAWVVIIVLMVATMTCCKDKNSENSENNPINDWILENMQVYYLWENKLPAKTDKSLYPADYFETLLYKPTDRFSWIEENYVDLMNSFSGVVKEAGYDFNLFQISGTNNVAGGITYVKPGSPAEQAGLKRGDYFTTINKRQMTVNNYSTLLDEIGEAHTLGIITDENFTDISLSVVVYEENPILLDTIYTIESKKVGYLVYNFFAPDNGDGSKSYEKQLNTIFANFKSAPIDELVLDFRYNGGGYISTAIILSGMISNCTSADLFGFEQYNDVLTGYYLQKDTEFDKIYFEDMITRTNARGAIIESTPIEHLGMNRLYVLTSHGTASASELVINSLSPYLNNNIVLIGDVTYGKNVGSMTLYEKDVVKQKTNKWGMQPIVMKSANKEGFSDYGAGFPPDVAINEWDYDIKPLGNLEEPMLQAAIDHIFERTSQVRRSNIKQYKHIGSSIDRTPARQNMLITPRDLKSR